MLAAPFSTAQSNIADKCLRRSSAAPGFDAAPPCNIFTCGEPNTVGRQPRKTLSGAPSLANPDRLATSTHVDPIVSVMVGVGLEKRKIELRVVRAGMLAHSFGGSRSPDEVQELADDMLGSELEMFCRRS